MKAVVFACALLFSPIVFANERCEAIADGVYIIAEQRDAGVTRREMRSRVITKVDEDLRDLYLRLVDMVYERPHGAPHVEADMFYNECAQAQGTKTRMTF